MHYACYPPGAGYVRHVDCFRDDAARVISLVLYLNDNWRDADGGALRIYATRDALEPACELAPRGGMLVAMRSEAIAHEVLPANAERWSIAGWLRRRPEQLPKDKPAIRSPHRTWPKGPGEGQPVCPTQAAARRRAPDRAAHWRP